MKTIILMLAQASLVITPPPPTAETENLTPEQTAEMICPSLGGLAQSIMHARQSGVLFSDLVQAYSDVEDPYVRKVAASIVRDAYSRPLYRSREYQNRTEREFRNYVEIECWNAITEKP